MNSVHACHSIIMLITWKRKRRLNLISWPINLEAHEAHETVSCSSSFSSSQPANKNDRSTLGHGSSETKSVLKKPSSGHQQTRNCTDAHRVNWRYKQWQNTKKRLTRRINNMEIDACKLKFTRQLAPCFGVFGMFAEHFI